MFPYCFLFRFIISPDDAGQLPKLVILFTVQEILQLKIEEIYCKTPMLNFFIFIKSDPGGMAKMLQIFKYLMNNYLILHTHIENEEWIPFTFDLK